MSIKQCGLAVLLGTVWVGSPIALSAYSPETVPIASFLWHCAEAPVLAWPCDPTDPPLGNPPPPPRSRGYTGLANPAVGKSIRSADENPLDAFTRRPLDRFIIPAGGLFMDLRSGELHYGVDYTYPDDYLQGIPLPVYSIGPGYVTARSTCLMCYVDGDSRGRVEWRQPRHNFGFGNLVVVESPYNAAISIYTMYAHLDRDFVSLGDYVTPDTLLGTAGVSGYAEEIHVHLEIRYGTPGRFWNADFTQWSTLDRWMGTMFVNPALLVMPENHSLLVEELEIWATTRPQAEHAP